MRIGGLDLDPTDGDSSWSHHLTFDHITWTAALTIRTRGNNQAILFDSSVFDSLAVGIYEGRISVRGYNNTQPVGVTISNSHLGGGGCSDGVQIVGNAYGVQIGPGNEFEDLTQGSCAAHVDPIQLYGSRYTLITGNWFHNNTTGIAIFDGGDHETVTGNVIGGSYHAIAAFGACVQCVFTHNVVTQNRLDWSSKAGTGPSSLTARDNVFLVDPPTTAGSPVAGTLTEDHNLCVRSHADCDHATDRYGTPVFVGGSNPASFTSRDQYRLAAGSPGKNAASDGTDIGIPG
jgi:hypothetical protein